MGQVKGLLQVIRHLIQLLIQQGHLREGGQGTHRPGFARTGAESADAARQTVDEYQQTQAKEGRHCDEEGAGNGQQPQRQAAPMTATESRLGCTVMAIQCSLSGRVP